MTSGEELPLCAADDIPHSLLAISGGHAGCGFFQWSSEHPVSPYSCHHVTAKTVDVAVSEIRLGGSRERNTQWWSPGNSVRLGCETVKRRRFGNGTPIGCKTRAADQGLHRSSRI